MLRGFRKLLFSLSAFFLINGCSCRPEGEPFPPLFVKSWQGNWLDNRGIQPIVTTDSVARLAVGIRLSARLSQDGQDTLYIVSGGGDGYSLRQPVQKIQFFTTQGFDGLPADTDISDRFRVRVDSRDGYSLQYFPVGFSVALLNMTPAAWGTDYHLDFPMIAPPSQTGPFECAIRITFDSTATPPVDTFFSLPPVFLQ